MLHDNATHYKCAMNFRFHGALLAMALPVLSCSQPEDASPKLDAAKSSVTVDSATAVADGVDEIIVTVSTVDEAGEPFEPEGVTISMTGEDNNVSQPSATGSTVDGRVRSGRAEVKTISVTVKAGGEDVAIGEPLEVTFTPGPIDHIEFTTQPHDVAVGVALNPIIITVYDNKGNVAPEPSINIYLRITGVNVPNMSGGEAKATVNGVATFDNVTFDGPCTGFCTTIGMQARQDGEPGWAVDATTEFTVTQ